MEDVMIDFAGKFVLRGSYFGGGRFAQDGFEENKHPRAENGRFGTAGGFTAEEHAARGKHHSEKGERQEAAIRAKGGPKGGLGTRSKAYYTSQSHKIIGVHHNAAAEHLRAGRQKEAEESAATAAHHAKNLPESEKYTKNAAGKKTDLDGKYNAEAVNKAIANNRTGKIGGREAKAIHALLKGRH